MMTWMVTPRRAASVLADAATRHGHRDEATRYRDLAASYRTLHEAYQQREAALATAMADRAAWDNATRQQRQLAIAAEAELRRRHPGQHRPRCAQPNPSHPPRPLARTPLSPHEKSSHAWTSGSPA